MQPRSGLAIASLVLGIIALLLSIVVVGGALGLVAVVLGIIAINRPGRREMAVWGIVTGGVAMAIAVILSLVAVLVFPALTRARSAAADVRAMANLRQLQTAFIMYANDNRGFYPPGIAYAGPYVGGMSSVLQDPRVHTHPVPLPAGSAWVSNSAEVESHFDYVYTGAGLQMTRLRNPGTFIVMYDRPVPGHQRLIAFGDGHVERMPQSSAMLTRAVQSTNQTRASLHMPLVPVDLSGPP